MIKVSNSKIIKAGAGYVIGNYLLKGITFLSAPIFTRLLTTEEYGNVSTYMSYESILYIVIGLALHSCLNTAKYKYGEKINEFISSILTLIYISLIIFGIIANVFYSFFADVFGFSRLVLNILLFHCFASSLLQLYNSYASLSYSYKSYIKITSINALSNMLLSVVLILTICRDNREMGRIIGIVLPILLISLYIICFFYKVCKPIINKEYYKFALTYSFPIIPHGISQVVLSSFDRIMIKNMVGSAAAGIYSFSHTIQLLINVAITSLANVWKPWMFEKMETKSYDDIKKGSTNYVLGIAFFTVLVMFASPELIKILGDKKYWNSTDCVIPVLLGSFFCFLYNLPSLVEYYYEKTRFIALGTILAAAINIVLNYIFIPQYGYIAAAYTTLFTYCLYFIFHYVLARIIHGSFIFSTVKITLICLAVLIFGFAAILLTNLWIIRWIIDIIIMVFFIKWANSVFDLRTKIKQHFNR